MGCRGRAGGFGGEWVGFVGGAGRGVDLGWVSRCGAVLRAGFSRGWVFELTFWQGLGGSRGRPRPTDRAALVGCMDVGGGFITRWSI